MKKPIFLSLVILIMAGTLSAQLNYRVQVGVFEQRVDLNYFTGLTGVWGAQDHNDLYRYYLGDYASDSEAKAAQQKAIDAGFVHAQVIDLQEIYTNCNSCSPSLFVRSIFFDFDKSFLRTQSKRDLDHVVTILSDNPTYQVELKAHTDSRGSNEYNVGLSQRRADSARAYMVSKGVADGRIITTHHGETSPIARNDMSGGKDSPQGRQLNRRVVVSVLDASGRVVPNGEGRISVPDELRLN